MKPRRLFSVLLVLICCLAITPVAFSEENSNSGSSGSSNEFLQGLMGILQESIDEFIGSYKGSLGDIRLLERKGNKIILEVTYDNVKRSDNVHVQGEVHYFGIPLEGFSNTLNSIQGSQGKVKLAIGRLPKEEDAGWDTTATEEQSDQIRLFLVRKSNPDRPFGEIIYDLPKTWTNSDEPDAPTALAGNDGIELEDKPAGPNIKPLGPVFVKPGTILKPYTPGTIAATTPPAATQPAVAQPAVTQTPAVVVPQTTARAVIPATSAPVRQIGVTSYDLYANAKSAKWLSSAGPLSFPGSGNDPKGFARLISKGYLNSGNAVIEMLQTHPQWKSGGWIDGEYPLMIPGDNLHFKSVVGFLKDANQTDGVTFQVYVKENNKYYQVASHKVTAKNYVSIDADLSRWSGKQIRLVLRVRAGNTANQDWAVWVKPRLTK